MAKKKSKPAENEAPEKMGTATDLKKPEKMTVKIGDTEFKGACTSRRTVGKTKQVFLKLNGCVSRWFNEEDVQ